ncbi:unnamed protein product [Closterium sp. NIES-54]
MATQSQRGGDGSDAGAPAAARGAGGGAGEMGEEDFLNASIESDSVLLRRMWQNEKAAPDILPYETELVERTKARLEELEEMVDALKGDGRKAMERELHMMDVDRTKYLLRAYLRCRIQKIDRFFLHFAGEESYHSRLSDGEQRYCDRQVDLVQAHLDRTALTRLPRRYQSILKQADSSETPDMIPTPDLDTFVFCVATRPLPSVQLDPEQDDIIGMAPGELHILRYRPIQTLVQSAALDATAFSSLADTSLTVAGYSTIGSTVADSARSGFESEKLVTSSVTRANSDNVGSTVTQTTDDVTSTFTLASEDVTGADARVTHKSRISLGLDDVTITSLNSLQQSTGFRAAPLVVSNGRGGGGGGGARRGEENGSGSGGGSRGANGGVRGGLRGGTSGTGWGGGGETAEGRKSAGRGWWGWLVGGMKEGEGTGEWGEEEGGGEGDEEGADESSSPHKPLWLRKLEEKDAQALTLQQNGGKGVGEGKGGARGKGGRNGGEGGKGGGKGGGEGGELRIVAGRMVRKISKYDMLLKMLAEVARKEQQAKWAVAEWKRLGNPWPPVVARPDLLARNELLVRNADKFPEAGVGRGGGVWGKESGSQGGRREAERGGAEAERRREGGQGGEGGVGGQEERVIVVLYVHRREEYLRVSLDALSKVQGINETLLIVSHDGFFPAVDALIRSITFCRVKQIFFPLSLHLQNGSFPNRSPLDCPLSSSFKGRRDGQHEEEGQRKGQKNGQETGQGKGQENGQKEGLENGQEEGQQEERKEEGACFGDVDQNGRYRDPHFVALKHHWWWMQNTVWDGLSETNTFTGHMLFIEEDHLLFPNALAHLKSLIRVKNVRCPECVAVTLAPSNVKSRGESGLRAFVRERMGNVGYAFNRSVWKQIHKSHKYFCYFDDYNWDVSLSESIFHYWRQSSSLRWSAASAHHFGRCGLHSEKPEAPAHYLVRKNKTKSELGEEHVLDADARVNPRGRLDSHGGGTERYRKMESDFVVVNVTGNASSAVDQCSKEGLQLPRLLPHDLRPDMNMDAPIRAFDFKGPVFERFTGFGGWGDGRDHMLCMHIGALFGKRSRTPQA